MLMRRTLPAKSATFTVAGTAERRSSMYRRNSSGDRNAPCESPYLSGADPPISSFISTLAVRFDRTGEVGRKTLGGRSKQEFLSPNLIESSREVKESHQSALRLGGLEAVADGLRDSENFILVGA